MLIKDNETLTIQCHRQNLKTSVRCQLSTIMPTHRSTFVIHPMTDALKPLYGYYFKWALLCSAFVSNQRRSFHRIATPHVQHYPRRQCTRKPSGPLPIFIGTVVGNSLAPAPEEWRISVMRCDAHKRNKYCVLNDRIREVHGVTSIAQHFHSGVVFVCVCVLLLTLWMQYMQWYPCHPTPCSASAHFHCRFLAANCCLRLLTRLRVLQWVGAIVCACCCGIYAHSVVVWRFGSWV